MRKFEISSFKLSSGQLSFDFKVEDQSYSCHNIEPEEAVEIINALLPNLGIDKKIRPVTPVVTKWEIS